VIGREREETREEGKKNGLRNNEEKNFEIMEEATLLHAAESFLGS
jgi:hypothetical protein